MLCEICKNDPATVHLTQIVSGKMQKIDLCEKCAKEKGVADPAGFSLADMLLGLGAGEKINHSDDSVEMECPACGFTQADFKKTGRLGCPVCYQTFGEGLEVILKDMHKGTEHKGKIPARQLKSKEFHQKLGQLEKSLTDAVKHEKYEEAASLRDQIAHLQKQLQKS